MAWAALIGVAIAAAPPASWTATQTHFDPSGNEVMRSRWDYAGHHVRIEGQGRAMVIDLKSGAFTVMMHDARRWARVSLDELIQMRDRMKADLTERMKELPPAMRSQLQAQLEAQVEAARKPLAPRATGVREEIDGLSCEVFRWSRPEGDGSACIATEVGVDVSGFRSDIVALNEKLTALSAGGAADSMVVLQLGDRGFPLRTRQTIQLGASTQEIESRFSNIAASKLTAADFAPPDAYRRVPLEELMAASVAPEASVR